MKEFLEYLYQKDQHIFLYFNSKLRCKLLDVLMPRITHLGGVCFSVLLCVVLYIFGPTHARIAATEAAITLTGSQSIVQLFKKIIYRKRPYLVIPNVKTFWARLLKDHSFPSGHTTAGFSMAVILSIYFPIYAYFSYGLATMVGVSRVYTGMHYPSDVLSGAFLGTVFAFLTHSIM